jgi:uncharacterized Ntn-hydrolase superfamily protein
MSFKLGPETHTFTMVARCAESGLLGICLTSSPLNVAARCPFAKANVAAVATQAYSDPALGPLALNLLEAGYSPERTIQEMCANDEWADYRQHGIVDRNGRSAAFTGKSNLEWAGHQIGPDYVAMGNYLTSSKVVDAMARTFVDSRGQILEERLVRAIESGKAAGGEKGGHLSSGLLVYGNETYPRTDLRVDMYPSHEGQTGDAVDELRRIFNVYTALIPYYEQRPRNPLSENWRDWIKRTGGHPAPMANKIGS